MQAWGLKKIPPCFYCGVQATTIDHVHPKSRLGASDKSNIKPACRRCNTRKSNRPVKAFRAQLKRLARACGRRMPKLRFYGEGARGSELSKLRALLTKYVKNGKVVIAKPEGTWKPLDEKAEERRRERLERIRELRWPGRLTFQGGRALRAISRHTGCSGPTIERFLMNRPTHSDDKIREACVELGLDVEKLRKLKPQGPPPRSRPAPSGPRIPMAARIAAARAAVAASARAARPNKPNT